MLEHGELKIDLYHQMNSADENDKRPLDIHLCYCIIPLRDLVSRHTGLLRISFKEKKRNVNLTFILFKVSKVGIHCRVQIVL